MIAEAQAHADLNAEELLQRLFHVADGCCRRRARSTMT